MLVGTVLPSHLHTAAESYARQDQHDMYGGVQAGDDGDALLSLSFWLLYPGKYLEAQRTRSKPKSKKTFPLPPLSAEVEGTLGLHIRF